MAFCSQCGSKIEDGVKFCPSCGSPVQQVSAGAALQQATAPQPAQPVQPRYQPQAAQPVQPQPQQPQYQPQPVQPQYQPQAAQPVQPQPQQPQYQPQPVQPQPVYAAQQPGAYANAQPGAAYQGQTAQAVSLEEQKAAFAQAYPNLAGCVPAGFGKRFGRGIIVNVAAFIIYLIVSMFNLIPMMSGSSFYSYYLPNGWIGTLIGIIVLAVLVVLEYYFICNTGKDFVVDNIIKLRWADATTGGKPKFAGLFKQDLIFGYGPMLIVIVSGIVTLLVSRFAYVWAFFIVWNIIVALMGIGLLAAAIVAWVEIYQDKVSHRCYMDRIAGVVMIDVEKGRDPFA